MTDVERRQMLNERAQLWRLKNLERSKAISRRTYEKKKAKDPHFFKKFYEKNRTALLAYAKEHNRRTGRASEKRLRANPEYREKQNARHRIAYALGAAPSSLPKELIEIVVLNRELKKEIENVTQR